MPSPGRGTVVVRDFEAKLGRSLSNGGYHGGLGDEFPDRGREEGEERIQAPVLGGKEVGQRLELTKDRTCGTEGGCQEATRRVSSTHAHVLAHNALCGGVGLGGWKEDGDPSSSVEGRDVPDEDVGQLDFAKEPPRPGEEGSLGKDGSPRRDGCLQGGEVTQDVNGGRARPAWVTRGPGGMTGRHPWRTDRGGLSRDVR